jgi:hypothetical protein
MIFVTIGERGGVWCCSGCWCRFVIPQVIFLLETVIKLGKQLSYQCFNLASGFEWKGGLLVMALDACIVKVRGLSAYECLEGLFCGGGSDSVLL